MDRFMSFRSATNNNKHVAIHAGSIFLATISQVVVDVFVVLAKGRSVPNALFQTTSRNVSETFPLEVTMDWWSEYFSLMIDWWSKAWLVYAVVSLYRRNTLGPESCNPEIHSPVFYLMWIIINISRMCSMPLLDRHYVFVAVLIKWIPPVLSFYMLYMSYVNLNHHKAWLAINSPRVISWTQYLTQNGVAVFAWWSLLDAILGIGIVLKYHAGVSDPFISTVVLTIITVYIVIWFILQCCLLTKYMCHTFGVYAILVLGLGAMFTRSYHVHDLDINTIYCGCIMLLITIMSLIHLVTACVYGDSPSEPLVVDPSQRFEACVNQRGITNPNFKSDNEG